MCNHQLYVCDYATRGNCNMVMHMMQIPLAMKEVLRAGVSDAGCEM